MKTLTIWMALIGLAWVSVVGVGCQAQGPREGYAQANDAFIAAQEFLIQQRISGAISDAEWEDIYRSLVLGDVLLQEYARLSAAGEPTEGVAAQLRQVLEAIQPFLIDLADDGR